jgi:hypothetical protein
MASTATLQRKLRISVEKEKTNTLYMLKNSFVSGKPQGPENSCFQEPRNMIVFVPPGSEEYPQSHPYTHVSIAYQKPPL